MDNGSDEIEETTDPRLWTKAGWTARVIKNDDDDGWAVAMTRVGASEPSLVGPWTMGRDKKNPKPLDHAAFTALVKGANEIVWRHEHAARARLHRELTCVGEAGRRLRADFQIQPDEDDPHAILSVFDELTGELLRSGRASPVLKLTEAGVLRFLRTGEA
jgi:hypothetical protein